MQQDCQFDRDPTGFWSCQNCGYVFPLHADKPPYRNCDWDGKSRGLGDTIAKVTKAVGIKPCGGCGRRRKKLNKMFPYGKTA